MTKYVHVSLEKRQDKTGLRLGGVAKFGWYLKRAIPDLQLISWTDYPDWMNFRGDELSMVRELNSWLVKEKIVDENTVAIFDGWWGSGLEDVVARAISVCHGSYWGRYIQYRLYPWPGYLGDEIAFDQLEYWETFGGEIVCVNKQTYRELRLASIKPDKIIFHGVDLEAYRPMFKGDILMHAASSPVKGSDVIARLNGEQFGYNIEYMNHMSGVPMKEADRLNHAFLAIVPSHYEGNSYFINEALACGVPVVGNMVGSIYEMDRRCGILTDDLSPEGFSLTIETAHEIRDSFKPREWAEENCSFETFQKEWRSYLEYSG